ncbi:MAG: serine hydrolase domain-containing protein [Actinomycetota bacterium]
MTGSRLRGRLEAFRAKHSIPALGAGVVGRDGLLDADVVGVRLRDGDDPVQPEDRWHLGSCGKSITAALYARLVERGDAAWGARLADLFPDLAGSLDAGWSLITIDDLFVSRGGLPANLARSAMQTAFADPRPIREQRTEVAAQALARPPRRPGRFVYSNLGYIVIGAAIERITDRSYEDALAAHVLEPLGITSGASAHRPRSGGTVGACCCSAPWASSASDAGDRPIPSASSRTTRR